MRTSKKALSLLLVLVMVFAFSANAFAAPSSGTGTIVISHYLYGDLVVEDVDDDQTVKDALDYIDDIIYGGYLDVEWDVNFPSYLYGIMGENSRPIHPYNTEDADARDIVETAIFSEAALSDVEYIFWDQWVFGYGDLKDEYLNAAAPYNRFYAGYDWTYTVDGVQPVDPITGWGMAMDEYVIQDGDYIVINYDFNLLAWDASNPNVPSLVILP